MKNILALSSISIPYLRRRGGREREREGGRGRGGDREEEGKGEREGGRKEGKEKGREEKAHTCINTSIHKLLCVCVFSKRKYVCMYCIT